MNIINVVRRSEQVVVTLLALTLLGPAYCAGIDAHSRAMAFVEDGDF